MDVSGHGFEETPRLLEIPVELLVPLNLQLLTVDTRVGLLSRSFVQGRYSAAVIFGSVSVHLYSIVYSMDVIVHRINEKDSRSTG